MAIDVQSEVEKIARLLFDNATKTAMRRETGFEQCDALMTRYLMIANHLINDLVTRAVAEAKREQMERDCKAVCHLCGRPEWTSPDSGGFHHSMTFHQVVTCPGHAIRAAFAATEPRDAAKDDARQRFDHAAVELRQYLGMGTLDMAAKFGPDFDPDEYAKGLAESFDSAARELGLDGAA